jgi:signal transduction histidine kinase
MGAVMSPSVRELAQAYSMALQEYNASGSEAALLRAYQLGRHAVSDGVGVLEMAALHQQALGAARQAALNEATDECVASRAAEFLAEALAPFELTRRGFQQISDTLKDVNAGLQHRLEAALQAFETAQDELLERRRLEELKNEFICIISHEVRTPLTSIHGALNLLTSGLGGALNDQGRQLLEVAYRNSQRLVRLVTDILDLQKIESGAMTFNMRPIEVKPFLLQAIDASQGYANQFGVHLEVAVVPRRAHVRADADRLMQVMDNLLSNAAKFSPPEGTVTVGVSRVEGRMRVSVQDRGAGVPDEFRNRIFQKFAQADAAGARSGCGLGLSISKAIVEQLGGRLDFVSAPGEGTTFFFELPEWDAKRGAPKEDAAWRGQA